jgi:hypothetical protein
VRAPVTRDLVGDHGLFADPAARDAIAAAVGRLATSV